MQTTLFEAQSVLRNRRREKQRIEMVANLRREGEVELEKEPWRAIEPHLNDALMVLGESERDAVILRYLQCRHYATIAELLGLTEATARQRVHRGLDQLRGYLVRQRVMTAAPILGSILKIRALEPAPAPLTLRITSAAAGSHASGRWVHAPALKVVLPLMVACCDGWNCRQRNEGTNAREPNRTDLPRSFQCRRHAVR